MATAKKKARARAPVKRARRTRPFGDSIADQLVEIQNESGDGELAFGRGVALKVTSLDKPFFPDDAITKGDLMRYYAIMSPMLLPVIADRPLVLKRYPDGIAGESFFQQNAGPHTPRAVRTATIRAESGERATRIVGGDLPTLLYTVQIGAIAVHAWQTRLRSLAYADTTTIDLDPADDVPFSQVVLLARHVKAELDRHKLHAAIKTSGSSGLHIVLPLPPKTRFADAAAIAERISEEVVERHPKLATVERRIQARPAGSIYVDAQQNSPGKSVVAAYSVRERTGATVSMPLHWQELRSSLRLESFTLATAPGRVRKVGELWGDALKRKNSQRAIDALLRT